MKREITCDKCEGKGRIPLPESLQETLSMVPRNGGINSFDLSEMIAGVSRNAQNNRLERLRDLGFVKRARHGKWWFYSRA